MTDNIKDAIVALQNGDSAQFKDTVNQELMTRAMDHIQIQKIAAGQSFFDDQEVEVETEPEVENEIDPEVSEEEPDEEV